MRKTRRTLELISVLAGGALCWITASALYGANRLPDRIPTHFGPDGQPSGWGPPSGLNVLPFSSLVIYLILTLAVLLMRRYPELVNFPFAVSEEDRPKLVGISMVMVTWLKVELMCLFFGIQYVILDCARKQYGRLSPAYGLAAVAVIFGTIGCFSVAMYRARTSAEQS
jgi:uncharacterized membrane protein